MIAAYATGFEPFRRAFQIGLSARMPEHVQRLGWDAERIAAHQRRSLRALLAHAVAHSRFHARRLGTVDLDRVELGDLPIMTKSEMMASFDDVVTDARLSRGLAEDAIGRTREEPVPLFGKYICQASGGSSGERGVFVSDLDGTVEFVCSIFRPTVRRGGVPADGRVTIALIAAGSAVHATGMAPALMEGTALRFVSVPATLPIAEIVDRLNALDPHEVYGYPTMLARLALERDAGRLRIAPRSIRCTSETLLPQHRAAIRAAFDAPLVDTFGSSEGLMGVSDPDDPILVFASDLCIVEPVDDRDRPVPPGEPSAKVLVTNLVNRVQPLIRYVLADSFVCHPPALEHGHLRATVQGRADDVLRYGATDVHPLVVRAVLVKTPAVIDYQVRQTPSGIDVALVTGGPLDLSDLSRRLCAALAAAGLHDPTATVHVVPTLDRHPGTAKLRRFIAA